MRDLAYMRKMRLDPKFIKVYGLLTKGVGLTKKDNSTPKHKRLMAKRSRRINRGGSKRK